ncbi:MAG: HAD family hydrolase [Spirochaetia bacterium]|jgi:phosphoglycolate phosphatase|nr:HAD family hydrolase [Spirochaetia bacterium]
MKYKAVIFDLDGTLLYTLGDIALALNMVLTELDMPTHPEEAYMKFVGHGLMETLKRACPEQCSEEILEKGYLRVIEEYSKNPVIGTKPYEGISQLLDSLIDKGIKIAILSNKEDKLVKYIAEKLLSTWHFLTIQGILPDVPPKPDPFAVNQIIKDMNVEFSEAIFVGDSGVDMKTAANSGLLGVGVTWGYRDIVELTEAGAGIVIDKPEDLVRILGE